MKKKRYHAFISYKHARSSEFAKRLELALKTYAKPLLKPPRSIFRDENILRPGPDLQRMIWKALDESEFLVYLASPDAAASEWVQDELRHWCQDEARRAKLIIVLTEGTIAFQEPSKTIDWTKTNALPQLLRDVLQRVPLYLDCTQLIDPERQTLLDPDFKKDVNKIVATFLGVDPGALSEQAVLQHRKNLRDRRLLVASVVVAVLVAVVVAPVAFRKSREAAARQLIERSQSYASIDPERSQLLALEAYRTRALPETEGLIRVARFRYDGLLNTYRRGGAVRSAVFSPDGKTILTASEDGTTRLWDAATATARMTLAGHSKPVREAIFSPDGTMVLTASEDGTARLWDARTGGQLAALASRTVALKRAAFGGDGKTVMTVAEDGIVQIWDAVGYRLRAEFDAGIVLHAALSPDSKIVVTANDGSSCDVWDANTGRALGSLQGHEDAVYYVAFSRDGEWIVTSSNDGTARVWNAATRQSTAVLKHGAPVTLAELSPDGKTVVTAGLDDKARLWEVRTGEPLALATLNGHKDHILAMAFSPDGRTIVTAGADGTVRLWESAGGLALATLEGHRGAVGEAAFSADGRSIVTAGSDGTARRWSALAGRPRITLDSPSEEVVRYAAFSPDGKTVATTGDSGSARLWAAESGSLLATFPGKPSTMDHVAFSPDGKTVLTMSDEGKLWRTDGTLIRAFGSRSFGGTFSRDGKTIATAGYADTYLWSAGGDLLRTLPRGGTIDGAAFSPDGQSIVTAGGGPVAKVWDVASGRLKKELRGHANDIIDAELSPDGTKIVTTSFDNTAKEWDSATGGLLATLKGHQSLIWDASFAPDGGTIATASADNTARLWDAATGHPLAILQGHGDAVKVAVWGPNGKTVLTASQDGTARLWDAASGRMLATFDAHMPLLHAAFSPDGRTILTTSGRSSVQLWDSSATPLSLEQMIDDIRRRVGRDLTPEERRQSKLSPVSH
jgi:WD40 repeat protein